MNNPNEFQECDTCRALPGTPPLCAGCLHNRELIGALLDKIHALRKKLGTAKLIDEQRRG